MDSSIRGMHQRVNVPGGTDTIGHSSVQAWSAGDLFPAVVVKVERYWDDWQEMADRRAECINAYVPMCERLESAHYELILDGVSEAYATYADAAAAARFLLTHPEARAQRKAEGAEQDSPYAGVANELGYTVGESHPSSESYCYFDEKERQL